MIRDVKFLMKLPDACDRAYGARLRDALRNLFEIIHKRERLPDWAFAARLDEARSAVRHQALTRIASGRRRCPARIASWPSVLLRSCWSLS